jgi:hypothetical protein
MAATPQSATPGPPVPEPAPPKPHHRTRNIAIAVAVVVVVIVVALVCLYTIPISTSYSYTITATATSYGIATFSPPSGAKVSGTFTSTDGSSIGFEILDSNHNPVFLDASNYGSFSFTASSPPYTFEAITIILSHTVDISGHYSQPYL